MLKYFVSDDADGEPTLWKFRTHRIRVDGANPVAVMRKSDNEEIWNMFIENSAVFPHLEDITDLDI